MEMVDKAKTEHGHVDGAFFPVGNQYLILAGG